MFTLNVYDFEKDELKRTEKRTLCPSKIYIAFADVNEKADEKDGTKLIEDLKSPMMLLFPGLTSEEYDNCLTIGDILGVFWDVMQRAPSIRSSTEKN